MTRARATTKQTDNRFSYKSAKSTTMPFGEHLRELRRRLMYVAISVILWSALAYSVERRLIDFLLQPSHGQKFIYTSPLGGMNFSFKACLYAGIALSIPVVVYQLLRYFDPLMKSSVRFVYLGSFTSGVLALGGMAFGYFVGLPAALNFLLHQFVTAQIHPLLTIESYLSFVTVYMLGAALMFQVPLIILFINRITPLSPRRLFKYERWAILFAVILAGIMNPTPNLFDQLFVAGPIIITYQLGILLVWWQNHTPKRVAQLHAMRAQDALAQAERERRRASSVVWREVKALERATRTPTRSWMRRPIVSESSRLPSDSRIYSRG